MIYGTHPAKIRDGGYQGDCYGNFGDLDVTVEDAVKALRRHVAKFNSVVVTGISGIVVGSPVALALKKPLVVVRKPSDTDNHSCNTRVIGAKHLGSRACFVDDLTATGNTRMRVQESIGPQAKIVMQYMYDGGHITEFDPSFVPQQPRMEFSFNVSF